MDIRSPRFIPGLVLALVLAVPASAGIGDFDPTFANGGRLDFPAGFSGLTALPDGRFQMVAMQPGRTRVLRLDPDGRPDPGFGAAGILETAASYDSTYNEYQIEGARAMEDGSTYVILDAQSIVTDPSLGGVYKSEARLVRIGPTGRPDPVFGPDGARSFPVSKVNAARYSFIWDYAVAPDGALYVLVGYYEDTYDCATGMFIYRLTPDGQLDSRFGASGGYRVDTDNNCFWGRPFQLVALAGDKLLLNSASPLLLDAQGHGETVPAAWQQWLVARGATQVYEGGDYLYTVNVSSGTQLHAVVARWRRDLSLDTAFGPAGSGVSEVDVGSLPFVPASASPLQVLAPKSPKEFLYVELTASSGLYAPLGSGSERRDYVLAIVRLQPGGALDRTFGVNGVVQSMGYVDLSPVQEQPDGSLVVSTGSRAIRLSGASRDSPGVVVSELSCDYGNSIGEKAGARLVRIWRTLGSLGPVTIGFHTQGLSATPGADYTDISGTLSWADGESGEKTISIPILDDSTVEPDEDLAVIFDRLSGDAALDCAKAQIVIYSDDSAVARAPPPPTPVAPVPPAAQGSAGGGGAIDLLMAGLLGGLLLVRAGRRTGRHSPPRPRLTVSPMRRPSP